MTQWHLKSKTKISGGKRNSIYASKKKLYQKGSDPTNTVLSNNEVKKIDFKRGHVKKIRLKRTNKAFISDSKTGKTFEAIIESVRVNNANRLFVRRNILTKGAIVQLKDNKGYALITSRPGQSGIVQGKSIEFTEEKKVKKIVHEKKKVKKEAKPEKLKEKHKKTEKPKKEKKKSKK